MRRVHTRLASCCLNHPMGWEWGNCGCQVPEECLLGKMERQWPEERVSIRRVNPFSLWLFHQLLRIRKGLEKVKGFFIDIVE